MANKFPVIGRNPRVAELGGSRRASREDINPGGQQEIASLRGAASADSDLASANYKANSLLASATAGFGGNIQSAGQALYKEEEEKQIAAAHLLMAKSQNRWATELSSRIQNADVSKPDGPGVTSKFIEDYDKDADTWANQFTTRGATNYVVQSIAEVKGHLLTKAIDGDRAIAGARAKSALNTEVNEYSSSARSDPSDDNVAFALKQFDKGLDMRRGQLDPAALLQLKTAGREAIAVSAVLGTIEANPYLARTQLKGSKWDSLIDGKQKDGLIGKADAEISARIEEQKRQQAAMEKQASDQKKARYDELSVAVRNPDMSQRPSYQQIIRADVEPGKRGELLDTADRIVRQDRADALLASDDALARAKARGDLNFIEDRTLNDSMVSASTRNYYTDVLDKKTKEADTEDKKKAFGALAVRARAGADITEADLSAAGIDETEKFTIVEKARTVRAKQAEAIDTDNQRAALARAALPVTDSLSLRTPADVIDLVKRKVLSWEKASPVLSYVNARNQMGSGASPKEVAAKVSEDTRVAATRDILTGRVRDIKQLLPKLGDGGMDSADFGAVSKLLEDTTGVDKSKFNAQLWSGYEAAVKRALDPKAGMLGNIAEDPLGEAKVGAFMAYTLEEYQRRMADPNNKMDPAELLNPLENAKAPGLISRLAAFKNSFGKQSISELRNAPVVGRMPEGFSVGLTDSPTGVPNKIRARRAGETREQFLENVRLGK